MSRKSPTPNSPDLPDKWQYESAVATIEAAIAKIEAGDLDLADIFTQFEAAVVEIRRCETFLAQKQAQVELLIETLVDQEST